MVLENRIGNAVKARNLALTVGFGIMAVAGCGFGSARDGLSAQDVSAPAINTPAM